MLEKIMVIEDVERDARKAATLRGKQAPAGTDLRMTIRVPINRKMMLNATADIARQLIHGDAPAEIAHDTANTCLRRIRGQENMREMIHTSMVPAPGADRN
jgi:hypothetical protein